MSVVGRRHNPGFIETCNPLLVTKPPAGANWVHQAKWEGYRAQAHLNDGEVEVYNRAGNACSATLLPVNAMARLRAYRWAYAPSSQRKSKS